MKFRYEPKFEIRDKKIIELDNSRIDLNRTFSKLDYQSSSSSSVCISRYTIDSLAGSIRRIESRIKKAKKRDLNLFDEIVLQDIERNVEKIRTYYDFFHNPDASLTTGQLLAGTCEKGAYHSILRAVAKKNFPDKELDKYSEMMNEMESIRLNAEIIFENQDNLQYVDLKRQYIEKLRGCKKSIDDIFLELGILNKPVNCNFEFAPRNWGFSFYDGSNMLIAIDPDTILCYRSNDQYLFFEPFIKLHAMHEYTHCLQEILSEKTMPRGLHPTPDAFVIPVHSFSTEGLALSSERLKFKFMKANRKQNGLSRSDLERCKHFLNLYTPMKLHQILYDIYSLQYKVNSDKEKSGSSQEEARKKIAKFIDIKKYRVDDNSLVERPFDETLSELAYFFGEKHTKYLISKMRKQKICDNIIFLSLINGIWASPEAQERFIFEKYLPEIMKNS